MLKNNTTPRRSDRLTLTIIVVAISCFSYAAYIALRYANQIPLDFYSFRQTQTALTAYWLYKDGFKLAYETPVGGAPWSIPFEFPLYQYIVAKITYITHYSLNATGRLVSFVFLILCLIPARSITRRLELHTSVFPIFTALLFSSPIYLYWGRTVMIETASVFFSVAAISLFISILRNQGGAVSRALFLLCMTLSILQKATTGLPVLALLSILYLFNSLNVLRSCTTVHSKMFTILVFQRAGLALLYIGFPLAIGIAWTIYTDQIKILNPLGTHLTSAALTQWNWGTAAQRFSSKLFSEVIWNRMFVQNLGGFLGLLLLLWGIFGRIHKDVKLIVLISVTAGLAPLFLFTNLHLIHSYYQSANIIFLIFAVAVCLSYTPGGMRTSLIFTMLILLSNYNWFEKNYLNVVRTDFNRDNSRDIAVAEIMKRDMPEHKAMVIFGNDWSSSISYLAERKSYTVPTFIDRYNKIATNPENFIPAEQLGGVVLCDGVSHPTINELQDWGAKRQWKFGRINACYIALPEMQQTTHPALKMASCEGSIDIVEKVINTGSINIVVSGWSALNTASGDVGNIAFITLTQANGEIRYYETIRVPRPDVAKAFNKPGLINAGFSSVIDARGLIGQYVVGLARMNGDDLQICPMHKTVNFSAM